MPKRIDPKTLPETVGTLYPLAFRRALPRPRPQETGRCRRPHPVGVNLLRLPPGAWSSQRHWHTEQDEFVYVLSGEVVLVTDDGEEILKAATAPASRPATGTAIICRTAATIDALVLEIGTRNDGDSSALFRHRHDGAAGRQAGSLYPQGRHALCRYQAARA